LKVPSVHVPSKVTLYWLRWNLWLAHRKVYTRADLHEYWVSVKTNLKQKRILHISPWRFFSHLWLDFQVTMMFAFAILRAREE
jgi:hypothetical protein